MSYLKKCTVILGLCTLSNAAYPCQINGDGPSDLPLSLIPVASGLTKPVDFIGVDSESAIVLEQSGVVSKLSLISEKNQEVLDLRGVVYSQGNETGLLGAALHPDFPQTPYIFLNFTTGLPLQTKISRFSWNGSQFDLASRKDLLSFDQPYANHNGGGMAFDAEGDLYIGVGDGGSGGDPQGNGQNLGTYLGTILKITPTESGYEVPSDNPFIGTAGAKPEIYAYGLRNPWRISIDASSGKLYAADVGQNRYEEINVITSGGNYGWNKTEGTGCFRGSCDPTRYVAPLFTYGRSDGVSVTGGFVYRGNSIPSLYGKYLFADYVSGNIWAMEKDGIAKIILTVSENISSFGVDGTGELYLLGHRSGKIFRLGETTDHSDESFPLRLSETDCFKTLSPLAPSEELVPYRVNSPLWSDGFTKDRYIYLPNGTSVSHSSENEFVYPAGSILIKHFRKNGKAMETRFIVMKDDGAFSAHSYRWLADQSDAVYIPSGGTTTYVDQGKRYEYLFPSRSACKRCHVAPNLSVLGFNVGQLNMNVHQTNQLVNLSSAKIFDPPYRTGASLPVYESNPMELDKWAKAYLAVNCGTCHNAANLGTQADFNLAFGEFSGVCDTLPRDALGVSDAKVIAPGLPEKSVLYLRMLERGSYLAMPPAATNRVDESAAILLKEWIRSFACR